MQFVDANIFLRHLTQDDPQKARACFALFKRAEANEIALTTSEAVISEVVYVLASKQAGYSLSPERIKHLLYPLLSLPGLKLPHRNTYLRALKLYALYAIDYEDCLTITHMERQHLSELYSYDRDFDPIQGVERLEPQASGE